MGAVKQVFVIDALGAAISVVILGFVLPPLKTQIGMPVNVLYGLTIWASCCMLYSLSCSRFVDLAHRRWLAGIMVANIGYTIATVVLIMFHFGRLTPMGIVYFVAEIPVLYALVFWERSVYRNAYQSYAPGRPDVPQ